MPTAFEQLAQPLSRLAARYAQSPIPAFLHWWGTELRACLPARWRQRFRVAENQLLLHRDGEELLVTLYADGERQELGRVPLFPTEALPSAVEALLSEEVRQVRRTVLLSPKKVLRRVLHLPAAAQENLGSVLGFELDRQTPFRADQVYYDHRVLAHEAEAKQIAVQLVLVTREELGKELTALGGVASSLSAVDIANPDGARSGFNLLPVEQRVRRSQGFAWLMVGLSVLTVFFLWMGMQQIVDNRQQAIVQLQADVDAQRAEARAVMQLRDELDEAVTGANFLAVEKARQPSMLLMLDELTRHLPDDTFLERMSITRGEMALAGQSAQAPKLVEILQTGKTFRSPALSGPIQPDPRSGKDRFNIAGKFGPETEDGDAPATGR